MRFGTFPLGDCEGAILAHALQVGGKRLKKGTKLDARMLERIRAEDVSELTVAILEDGDIGEDEAARRIAERLVSATIEAADAGTGRVNLYALQNGVMVTDEACINRINAVDPAITIATLAQYEPVETGRMVATVKIIPYAVRVASLVAVETLIAQARPLTVNAYKPKRIGLISTELPSLKQSVMEKTARILEQRLKPTGSQLIFHAKCAHQEASLIAAITEHHTQADVLIIFGASAICDAADVIPAALRHSGGHVERLGMPVDPGNLIMLGELAGKPVIGAPGCARSPARNGFDFVLERILAGLKVDGDDIAEMGVGGLLMEIFSRPQPREVSSVLPGPPALAAIVLAAGQSRRMGKENKLLLDYRGKPLVSHVAGAVSKLEAISQIHVVTGHQAAEVEAALAGHDGIAFTHNAAFTEGLSTSLRCGIRALSDHVTHVMVLLGDMPFVDPPALQKLLAALKPDANTLPVDQRIVVATHNEKRGNPVIWPRRFFDELKQITGDTGARHLLAQHSENTIEVEIGVAGSLDVDTPETYRKLVTETAS